MSALSSVVKAKVFHVLDSVYRDGYDAFKYPVRDIVLDLPTLDEELAEYSKVEIYTAVEQWRKARIN